jgi:hypothetical protein
VAERGRRRSAGARSEQATISESALARIDTLLYDADRLTSQLPAAERLEYSEAEESITAARRHAERHEGLLKLY